MTPAPLPWVAALTPLVFAIVMAVILQQVLALMMGFIGPAMVLGSWWESRRQARMATSAAEDTYALECESHASAVSFARNRERSRALGALPPLHEALGDPLWRRQALVERGVRVGTGWAEVPPGHELAGTGALPGMPCVVDPRENIALVGDENSVDIWRTVALSWILASPARSSHGDSGNLPRQIQGLSEATWVSRLEDVPEDCTVVLVDSGRPTIDLRRAGVDTISIAPDRLSASGALWALQMTGSLEAGSEPRAVPDYARRDQLWCSLSDTSAPWDLVAQGPHTVVWGATGSGKSVTVTTLVQRVLHRYSPQDVVCVLIDFKGGAGLRGLLTFPHTIGAITDMEGRSVSRALAGLHAELLRREKVLHQEGVIDIALLDPSVLLPRLIVCIDEAAWLLATFPDFGSALSDLLARGRSLGIHVVLSTQRVSGVLTHAMMANVSLRICGRVGDESDALTWIPDLTGSQRARVRHMPPGEVLIAGATLRPELAHTVPPTLEPPGHPQSPWRVFADPLPERLSLTPECWALVDDLPAGVHRQLSRTDAPPGSILVVGDSGTGRTTALLTLAAVFSDGARAPSEPLVLWLWWAENALANSRIVMDDADLILRRAGREGAQFLLELWEEGSAILLLSCAPGTPYLRSLSRLARDECVLPGGNPEARPGLTKSDSAVPGRAHYRGEMIQIASGALQIDSSEVTLTAPSSGAIVVTRNPTSWEGAPVVRVVSPEELAREWWEVSAGEEIVLDRVSHLDIRGASAGRIHPPPLPVPEGYLLVWCAGRFSLTSRVWWKD